MLTECDERFMDLYLLLLAHSELINKKDFFISLEAMALSLGMPDTWENTALRRQVIKSLKKLQSRYNLIKVKFFYGKDAGITIIDISGGSFTIPTNQIIQPRNEKLTMRLKFLFLIEALLESEGKNLESMSQPAIAKRFSIHRSTILNAFKDLKNCKK